MEQKIEKYSKYEKKIITIPNILSFFRICLIPIIVWLYTVEHNYVWTGYILIISGATDRTDGFIARHFHMVSNLGKIFDPIADKLTQGMMILHIFWHEITPAISTVFIIACSTMIGVSFVLYGIRNRKLLRRDSQ